MSANPTPAVPAAASFRPSPELVNAILKWPEEDRIALAQLLDDSIRKGFTSLEEAQQQEKELIHRRVEELVSGKVELLDPEQMFAAMRQRLAEARRK